MGIGVVGMGHVLGFAALPIPVVVGAVHAVHAVHGRERALLGALHG